MKKEDISLEDITRRKEEVLHELRLQHKVIGEVTNDVLEPLVSGLERGSSLLRKINMGMMIAQGVMAGVRLMRRLR
jgi:hypothetical protein